MRERERHVTNITGLRHWMPTSRFRTNQEHTKSMVFVGYVDGIIAPLVTTGSRVDELQKCIAG
jgi:hypothetical protein